MNPSVLVDIVLLPRDSGAGNGTVVVAFQGKQTLIISQSVQSHGQLSQFWDTNGQHDYTSPKNMTLIVAYNESDNVNVRQK